VPAGAVAECRVERDKLSGILDQIEPLAIA
jgi:hypothetical protein